MMIHLEELSAAAQETVGEWSVLSYLFRVGAAEQPRLRRRAAALRRHTGGAELEALVAELDAWSERQKAAGALGMAARRAAKAGLDVLEVVRLALAK